MVALGLKMAGVFANDQALVDKVEGSCRRRRRAGVAAAAREGLSQAARQQRGRHAEHRWPVRRRHHRVAVPAASSSGDVPWAHLDIAGTMEVDGDDGWQSRGATGFGTRLLIDLATTSRRLT